MRRPAHPRRPRIRVERLEDRSLPSFIAAPSVHVGPSGGAGSDPQAVVTGDFNRDGRLDAATANAGANGISVLLGTGTGGFKPAINIPLGRSPVGLLAADVNGDGKLDLVTANQSDNSITVLKGNGLGGFTIAGTVPAGPGPVSVAADDFNGDGHLDLAVADNGTTRPFVTGTTVTVLFGTGTGTFNPGPVLGVGTNPTSVAVGDFNGDTRPDIAVVSSHGSDLYLNLSILLNAGGGAFAAAANYHTGFCGNTVVVGDFNHDQKADLAVACVFPSDDGVSILLGQGDGTFPTYTNYDAGGQTPRSLAVGDFNGDGYADVVTANDQFANNSVSVLLNNQDGTFAPAAVYTAGEGTVGVAVGDLNGDGAADLVTADTGTQVGSADGPVGTATILLGNGDGTLVAAPDLTVATLPGPMAATDFTGDGIPDLAVLTWDVGFQGVTVFPGLGNGAFGPRLKSGAGINPLSAMTVGDVNGDGNPDAVVTTTNGVSVLLGNGNGTFSFASAPAVPGSPAWVAIADFTGDTKADLAVATDNGVSFLPGNGNGTFGTRQDFQAGGKSSYLAAADLNADGKTDLAVVNPLATGGGGNSLTVLLGQGDGTFTLSKTYPTRVGPGSVTVADFNHDGRPDLAVPTFFGPTAVASTVELFQNAGAGTFALKGEYLTDSLPTGSLTTDFNHDGRPDLAVATQFADTLFVFTGTGLGTLGKPAKYVVGDRPTWVATADFNGDGLPDMAVANSNSGTVTLLMTPLPVDHFSVNVLPPAVTAGKKVQAVVTARDAAGRLVPNFAGKVSLTGTDPKATLPLPFTFTPAAGGAHRFPVTLRTAGSQSILAHFGSMTGSGVVAVLPAAATHLKVIAPATAAAGTPFDVTVQALDRFGNPDPAFNKAVHFASTDPSAGVTLPADYTFAAGDNGAHTFTGVTLAKAGARSVSATALGVNWLYPKATAAVKVAAGAVSKFLVTGFPATIGAGVAHTFTVTAQDAFGNTVTNYLGTVQLTSTDGSAVLPGPYTFTALNKGKYTFTAKLLTPGVQSLTVTDAGDPTVTGSEAGITVI